MRPALAALLLAAASLTVGCAPKLIPGTEIKDTPEDRQILEVVLAYRNAVETKNIDKLMGLVSPTFFDNSGTPEPGDDYDRAGLEAKLRTWAGKAKAVRLDMQVKAIRLENDQARAQYFYDVSYQLPGPDNTLQWKRDSDTKEMALKREDGVWRITSGI